MRLALTSLPRNYLFTNLCSRRGDYSELLADEDNNDIPLRQQRVRHEHTLEAEILPNDTLNAISLRFNCTIQDLKRLNKIDKDNEIFAFRVLKVPLTAQNVLLDTLPKVHKSGQNSPKNKEKVAGDSTGLMPSKEKLEEKLLVASVSNAVIAKSEDAADHPPSRVETSVDDLASDPLLDSSNRQFRGYPRTFGAPRNDYALTGNDCELNWIVLLVAILAICIIVPLIYVYVAYEHPEEFTHHSRYDDTDLKMLHHIDDVHNTTTRSPWTLSFNCLVNIYEIVIDDNISNPFMSFYIYLVNTNE